MKRILFLVPSLGMGGMERVLVNYANLFSRRGYKVEVFNFTSHDEAIVQHFDKEVEYREMYTPVPHITHAKIKDILRFNFRILPFEKWIKYHSPKYLHKKYIKKEYDVEIGFFGTPTLKIVGGGNKKTVKLGWIHGTNIISDVGVGGYKQAKKVYDSVDKLICVSDIARKEMEETFLVNNAITVNNPNDTKKIRILGEETNTPEKKAFTFITAARIEDAQKKYLRLMNALKRLKDDGLSFEYWILGDGVDFQKVKDRAEELSLSNVHFFGSQSNPYKYIKKADMYVCASYSEGFSMVMMEALILGKPMLSTNVSGAAEMLDNGEYGIIVENSEDGLYEGMKKVLQEKGLFEHFVKKADERKDYLSEDTIMNRIEEIIQLEKNRLCQN